MYERQHQLAVLCLPNETMENRIDTPAISEEVVGQMVINNLAWGHQGRDLRDFQTFPQLFEQAARCL